MKSDCQFQFDLSEYMNINLQFYQNMAKLDTKYGFYSYLGLKILDDL